MTAVQREHRAIFEAIAAHDPVAARLHANEHLIRGEQRLVEGGIIDGRRRQAAARAVRAAGASTPRPRKQ
jgi:GntR family transcriptional repressor for pyruvate dehydrogenase complex